MAPRTDQADPPWRNWRNWRKSSRSMANGTCVEVKRIWRKATASMTNGACVEVAALDTNGRRDLR